MKKIFLLLTLIVFSQVNAFEITNKNINDLKFGKTNPTVKQLQIFLNDNGFYESEDGPGTPGNETEYFGNTTVMGIKLFQEYSELPVTGKVDFATGRSVNDYIKSYKPEEESEYFNSDGYSVKNDYNTGGGIDSYTNDITEIYLKKDSSVVKKNNTESEKINIPNQNQKWTLKELLEGTTQKNADTTQKQGSIFERFFSIFK